MIVLTSSRMHNLCLNYGNLIKNMVNDEMLAKYGFGLKNEGGKKNKCSIGIIPKFCVDGRRG